MTTVSSTVAIYIFLYCLIQILLLFEDRKWYWGLLLSLLAFGRDWEVSTISPLLFNENMNSWMKLSRDLGCRINKMPRTVLLHSFIWGCWGGDGDSKPILVGTCVGLNPIKNSPNPTDIQSSPQGSFLFQKWKQTFYIVPAAPDNQIPLANPQNAQTQDKATNSAIERVLFAHR